MIEDSEVSLMEQHCKCYSTKVADPSRYLIGVTPETNLIRISEVPIDEANGTLTVSLTQHEMWMQ
jgi:hypothetical protein